jgi:hypothetical protein
MIFFASSSISSLVIIRNERKPELGAIMPDTFRISTRKLEF